MKKIAVVTVHTSALKGSGHGFVLLAGEYEAVDIDGAEERHVQYLMTEAHGLVCVPANHPNIGYRDE
jgi:hypothetical protein